LLEYIGDSAADLSVFLHDIAGDSPKSYQCANHKIMLPDNNYYHRSGIATSHIKIKVSDKIAPGSYTVPVISRISFPAIVTLDVMNPFMDPTSNSTDGSLGPNILENNASALETIWTNITAAKP
jgi:hypothetical protein